MQCGVARWTCLCLCLHRPTRRCWQYCTDRPSYTTPCTHHAGPHGAQPLSAPTTRERERERARHARRQHNNNNKTSTHTHTHTNTHNPSGRHAEARVPSQSSQKCKAEARAGRRDARHGRGDATAHPFRLHHHRRPHSHPPLHAPPLPSADERAPTTASKLGFSVQHCSSPSPPSRPPPPAESLVLASSRSSSNTNSARWPPHVGSFAALLQQTGTAPAPASRATRIPPQHAHNDGRQQHG